MSWTLVVLEKADAAYHPASRHAPYDGVLFASATFVLASSGNRDFVSSQPKPDAVIIHDPLRSADR
ncbi:hypothetical protein [Mesorhizobium sp. CAU 1732]|uniref:hypothetical protein n=1 Tax=Mesorhizobium sp. CAU 1732 TaxID=3140358 RepID=UPI003260D7DF